MIACGIMDFYIRLHSKSHGVANLSKNLPPGLAGLVFSSPAPEGGGEKNSLERDDSSQPKKIDSAATFREGQVQNDLFSDFFLGSK
ncbi:hypothetical protein JXA32_00900 [Candidatus Sumerlaeota bacterium]|nr:hypothetical protein [Candidatus Sumerlaeota bacterium]